MAPPSAPKEMISLGQDKTLTPVHSNRERDSSAALSTTLRCSFEHHQRCNVSRLDPCARAYLEVQYLVCMTRHLRNLREHALVSFGFGAAAAV